MKKNKTKKSGILSMFFRFLPVLIKKSPVMLPICMILSVLHGVSWGVVTVSQNVFFDSAASFAAGEAELITVIYGLILLVAVNIISQILNGVSNFLPEVIELKIAGKFTSELQKKVSRLPAIFFEDSEQLDKLEKAKNGAGNIFWFVFVILSALQFYLPYFIMMAWYLFSLKPVLVLSLVIIFVPLMLTQILRAKVFSTLEDNSAPVRRKNEHYGDCITGRDFFRETRMLGAFTYFKKQFEDSLCLLRNLRIKAQLKSNLFELSMKVLTTAGYIAILFMLFDALMHGEITVGSFAAVFASIGSLYGIMEEIVCRHFGELSQVLGTVQNYTEFTAIPEDDYTDASVPSDGNICLENVSFSYPNAEKSAVNNVSFTINEGETVAVVGENGSGKSTLMRLITGIYKPSEGTVFHGGCDTKTLPPSVLFAKTSAVFQKFNKYRLTLRENISVSDLHMPDNDDGYNAAADLAGLDIEANTYPQGLDTMLSREFDGVDLSGGQWQRVAITRGYFKAHSLIVLDEPTAAIDPLEEKRLYERFVNICKNKTAFIVTHRLGSARIADRIIVMKDGYVTESGTHEQLLELNGEYARLYESQMQWYTQDAFETV